MRKLIIFLVFFIMQFGFAQVKFTVTVKPKVAQNERFQLIFTFDADAKQLKIPNLNAFRVLGNSEQKSGSWSNGVTSYKKSIIIILAPKKQGTFTISPASIMCDGKQYFTKPIKITVGKPVKSNAQRRPQQQQGYDPFANDPFFQDPFAMMRQMQERQRQAMKPPKELTKEEKAILLKQAKDEIFVTALVSKTDLYLNEAVTVSYRLYVSDTGVNDYGIDKLPEFDGFWSQDIKGPQRVQTTEIDGKQYRYVTLKKVLLFPQKTGELTIEPIAIQMVIEVPYQRDRYGRVRVKQEKIIKKTPKKILHVKPLPETGKPIDFSGAVGSFNFVSRLNKNQIKTGESAELFLRVQGTGNLKLFSLPEIKLSSELEVYEPEHQEKMRATTSGLQGFVSEKYVLVPEYGGKFPIQNLSFSYFDPKQEKYIRKNVANTVLNVLGAKKETVPVVKTTNTQNTIITFHPIKKGFSSAPKTTKLFFKTKLYWILLLVPFGIIPVLLLFKQRRDAYLNDVEGLKTRKASRLVKKYLSEARKNKNNKEAFYEALEKAYHNFLKAKLKIETSDFSQEKIKELLAKKNVNEDLISQFINSLKSCDMARYSPFTSTDIANEYDNAASIITQLNKIL